MNAPAPEDGTRGGYDHDHDVVIVGGGPAGCSAGVFTAREGLDTVIFDRARSSIKRCAHLENYLGFPDGIDIETLYDLMHEHARSAGCEIAPDVVESVDRYETGDGFVVERQDGEPVTARRVVAATRYDGSYMRGLDGDAAMFETYEHGGEEHERFRHVREAAVDDSLSSYVPREGIEARAEAGHETLATHLDVEAIVRSVDETALLDAMDDDLIREHVDSNGVPPEVSD